MRSPLTPKPHKPSSLNPTPHGFEKRHAQAAPHAETTVGKFLDTYVKEHMEAKKLASYESSEKWKIARIRERWESGASATSAKSMCSIS